MQVLRLLFVFGLLPYGVWTNPAEARTEQIESAKLPAEVQQNMQDANEYISRKAYPKASKELRETATLLRVEVDRTEGEAKSALSKSSAELDSIADDLKQGTAKSERETKNAFARAQHALAVEHQANAVSAWSERQGEKAAKELRLSAEAFENAAEWSGKELSTGTRAALRDIDVATEEVADGAKRAGKDVESAVSKMGSEVKNLGRRLSGKT